jgi:succinate dehydrogenase / fumarate reductase iron-sulfur subunit
MRINGHAGLACKTQAAMAVQEGDIIEVEPAGNMPVIKDLVTNFDLFWDKIMEVDPYLQPQGPEPEQEYVVSNESMRHLSGVTSCIMCGACVSDCTVMEVDPSFLGPAALAKAYRFTADPRDGDNEGVSKERLEQLNAPSGMWDCTRCLECVQACPKGVAPMERIMAMRDQAIAAGFHNTNGARHTEAFSESVEQTGTLDELKLVPKSLGMTNIQGLLSYAPVALQALTHGKMPPLMHKKIEGIEHVRRLFEKVDETER